MNGGLFFGNNCIYSHLYVYTGFIVVTGLTARRAEVLALVRREIQHTGMPPTRLEIAEALGKIQNIEYIVAAIPVPKLLAQSIRERERSANIPVADQVRTFFLAGCEVVLRTLDLAVERASGGGKPISEDDQSKLVNRLAGEVANFAQEQVKAEEDKGEEGARN